MDQRLKDLEELRVLQQQLEKTDSLQKQIDGYEARIREGVSEEYCYYQTKKETNLGRDLEWKYRKEHYDEAMKRAEKLNRARWIAFLGVFSLVLSPIAIILFVALTIAKNKLYYTWEGDEKLDALLSAKQKAEIEEAKRKDEEARVYNKKSRESAMAKSAKDQNAEIKRLNELLPGMRKELAQHQAAIAASNVLADDDKNLQVVNFLVKRLESRRANSVQEALLQYDAEKAAQDRRHYENAMRDLQRQVDAQRQLQESEDRLRQTLHNVEMERQARKAVKEIEEMRKDAENARRYGNP